MEGPYFTPILLHTTVALCATLGVSTAFFARFRRKFSSAISIVAGFAPWGVMFGWEALASSVTAFWIFIPLSPILFAIASIGFLRAKTTDNEKTAAMFSWIGLVVYFVWLFAFLSAASMAHV